MQDPRSVERLRQGDIATLKRLFKANHARLFPMAYRLTKKRESAERVIRNAFKRIWEERADLDVFEPLGLRLVGRTFEEAKTYREENGVTGFALRPDRGSQQDGLPELKSVDDDDLLNYLLFVVDGYSFRELAKALGSSVEDVQASVGRALVSLQESAASSPLDRE